MPADPTDPYGVDLAFDERTADLVVTPGGDLAFIQGPENVLQALTAQTRTYPGELTLHPDYGSQLARRLIGLKAGDHQLARSLANQQFAALIATDDRFLSATDIDALQDPDDPEQVIVTGKLVLSHGGAIDVHDLAEVDARVVVDEAGTSLSLIASDDVDDPFDEDLDQLEGEVDLADLLDEA